jgi:pyruvate/2-oxoglutarate dehydrogenase complex dihydrolipoamide acyltransferase (E2) component
MEISSMEDMEGGTFTITNGGVFGSLMSTPIINPPQSAILGMHKIQDTTDGRKWSNCRETHDVCGT